MKRAFLVCVLAATLFFSGIKTARASEGLFIVAGDNVYSFSAPQLKVDRMGARLSGKEEAIDGICVENYVAEKNAQAFFDPDGEKIFTFSKERSGKAIDRERLLEDIDAALSVGGGSVRARFVEIKPRVTVADLKKQTFERARFTTYFESSSPERIENVKLAAKSVSGTVLGSGETFSFNNTVGERSEARGYKNAKIIKDGRFEDGLGGGVCQVSTTLYNAALLSGLTIVESHPHSLAVSYVENSFDAMVSFGYADLKFRNDTKGSIFIAAYCDSKSITFVIFGERANEKIERVSVVNEIVYPKEIVKESPDLSDGETRRVIAAKKGYKSSGYLIVTRNGKKTKTLLRSDNYSAVDGLTEIGKPSDGGAAKTR